MIFPLFQAELYRSFDVHSIGLILIYTQSYTHFFSYQKTLCAISVILQKSHKSDIQQFDCEWLFVIFRSREPVFPQFKDETR
jgi:hypothetical protein